MESPHVTNYIEIDPASDVILFTMRHVKIRVSSNVLSRASKVFERMFSPNFAEGQNLWSDNPPVVSLPDDDAEAMTVICKSLYGQQKLADLYCFQLLDVALLVTKYDMQLPEIRPDICGSDSRPFKNSGFNHVLINYVLGVGLNSRQASLDAIEKSGVKNSFFLKNVERMRDEGHSPDFLFCK